MPSFEEGEELSGQVVRLIARLAELEERVEILERQLRAGREARPVTSPAPAGAGPGVEGGELLEAIIAVFGQLGEADAGALRQQLLKNGLPSSLSRSDVNKVLYANKPRFEVVRQDGVKPVWRMISAQAPE